MEEKEAKEKTEGSNTQIYYIIGAVALVLVLVAGYMLRPKSTPTPTELGTATVSPVEPTPATGPITGFACERQFYNPVVAKPEYFLGVEGADVKPATSVECTFTVSVAGKVVATDSAEALVKDAPERGGVTFRCDTKPLKLDKNIPTKVDVTLKDDQDITASCSRTFLLP